MDEEVAPEIRLSQSQSKSNEKNFVVGMILGATLATLFIIFCYSILFASAPPTETSLH